MLPAVARVRHRTEFSATLKRGRRAKRGVVVVHLAQRDAPNAGPRAGFIVSRAVGAAVTRNKVKRRLRHIVARRFAECPSDVDIVIRALPAAADTGYRQMAFDVDSALAACRRQR